MAARHSPGVQPDADYRIRVEPSPRRVRVKFNGQWIADSSAMILLYEPRHLPVYYFPAADVRTDLLVPTEHKTHCPYKGDASYWSIKTRERTADNAVWAYLQPFAEIAASGLADYRTFYWDRVDHWYEEDEEVFVHPRDPYKRVDAIRSSRRVQVILDGVTVAESTRTVFVFETQLPTRYYMPAQDVRLALLKPTPAQTRCPYKGVARYWTAHVNGNIFQDIIWSYPDPVAECNKIKDLLCFYNENVDAIFVDGAEMPKPRTKWSR